MQNLETVMAICRTLFHSLWEGALFALAGAAVIQLTKRAGAALRYQFLSALFILQVMTVAGTFLYEQQAPLQIGKPSGLLSVLPIGPALNKETTGTVRGFELSTFLNQNARLVVGTWLVVLILKLLWMLVVLFYTRYHCKNKAALPTEFWQERLKHLAAQLKLNRPVALLESAFIQVPVVFGHFKPLIFVPLGLLAQLPPGQAEAILLHELAHIRRRDYLMNILQNIVEALLFFNPALLWLSRRIREEREHCCDDIAISQTDRKQYVAALIGFREWQPAYRHYVPAFTGSSGLLGRVRRLALYQNPGLSQPEKGAFAAFALIAALLLLLYSTPVKRTVTQIKAKIASQIAPPPAVTARSVKVARIRKVPPVATVRKTYDRLEPMIADVTTDLVKAQVIADPATLENFELTNTRLMVNGLEQPQDLQEKLRQKYLEDPPAAIDRQQIADPHFGLYYNARTGFTGMGMRN